MAEPTKKQTHLVEPETRQQSKVPPKLSPEEAKRKIDLILRDGRFIPSYHCNQDSMPDAHVTDQDVKHVLQHGAITREPEWSNSHQNWKYKVEGIAPDGEELTVIVAILEKTFSVKVVTVW